MGKCWEWGLCSGPAGGWGACILGVRGTREPPACTAAEPPGTAFILFLMFKWMTGGVRAVARGLGLLVVRTPCFGLAFGLFIFYCGKMCIPLAFSHLSACSSQPLVTFALLCKHPVCFRDLPLCPVQKPCAH